MGKIKLHRNSIVYSILFVPILIDITIGIFEYNDLYFPIGKAYRGSIYLFGLFATLLRPKKNLFFYLIITLWLISFIVWCILNEHFSLQRELEFFFKVTYIFSVLSILNTLDYDASHIIKKIIKIYAQLGAFMIWFSFLTGIGLETYGSWVFGTSSFFKAQNDMGVVLLLCFTFLLFNKEEVRISWLWLSLIFVSLILLGTTTGMFGAVMVVVSYIFLKIVIAKITSVKALILRTTLFFTLFFLSVSALVFLVNYIKSSPYYSNKYEKLLKEGPRSTLTDAAKLYLKERDWSKNIFGEGFSSFTYEFGESAKFLKESKRDYKDWLYVETDYYDFYGSLGALISILLLLFYLHYLFKAGFKYYNKNSVYDLSLFMIMFMAISHGWFAGHVFYSPTVLGVIAGFIYLIKERNG